MAKFRKIKISNTNPEKRVGVAFALMGFIGLYAFLLSVWAGNAPDLVALLSILVLIVVGLGMHRRQRARDGKPPPALGIIASLKLSLGGRSKAKAATKKEEADEKEEGNEPPARKGLAKLFKRK